jgi:mannose-6-phosphate isomerase-like protein (cupin superfamily)
MKLPKNGHQLLQARKDGKRPKGTVLVTDTEYKFASCQLIVSPGERYDFTMLRDLDVFVVFEADAHAKGREWRDWIAGQIVKHARELYVIPSGNYWG